LLIACFYKQEEFNYVSCGRIAQSIPGRARQGSRQYPPLLKNVEHSYFFAREARQEKNLHSLQLRKKTETVETMQFSASYSSFIIRMLWVFKNIVAE
jgi:hypothetical protein